MYFGAITRPSLSPKNLNSHGKGELLKGTKILRPMKFFAWKLIGLKKKFHAKNFGRKVIAP